MKFKKGDDEMLGKIFGLLKDKSLVEIYSKDEVDKKINDFGTEVNEKLEAVEIKDGSITANKIADGAITETKLSTGSVRADAIREGTIEGRHLGADATNITGIYTGNGANSQSIFVEDGMSPQAVLIAGTTSGALSLMTSIKTTTMYWDTINKEFNFEIQSLNLLENDGFEVRGCLNNANEEYTYVAFR